MKIHFLETPWRLRHLLLLGVFIGLCAIEAKPTARALMFTFFGTKTEGLVTRVEWRRVSHRRSAPYHHFKYTTEGETARGRTRYPSPFVSAKAGDPVPVRYRGTDAEIASLNHLWGMPAIGLIPIAAVLALIVRWCRRNVQITLRA